MGPPPPPRIYPTAQPAPKSERQKHNNASTRFLWLGAVSCAPCGADSPDLLGPPGTQQMTPAEVSQGIMPCVVV
eukprot:10134285-Alexandrium_andersonii.AAC.1